MGSYHTHIGRRAGAADALNLPRVEEEDLALGLVENLRGRAQSVDW